MQRQFSELYQRSEGGVREPRIEPGHEPSLRDVTDVLSEVGGVLDAQAEILVRADMTPAEYRYAEDLVYRRWRAALRRSGTYPFVLRAAARQLEAAADAEPRGDVKRRLRELAAELRSRRPAAPDGIADELHARLLERIEEVEGYSLDELEVLPLPR